MARPKTKKTSNEVILEGFKKDQSAQVQALEKTGVFEAPKEKRQSNRELFSEFWALYKSLNKKTKNLEEIVWVHLVAIKHDSPEKFLEGIKHFGL